MVAGVLMVGVLLLGTVANAQVFLTNDGEVSFFSKTPLEDISAVSKKAQGALNIGTGDVLFKIPIKSFKFPNGLMEEHFNENYLESDKFPEATFRGKLNEKLDLTKDGTYKATAKGQFTLHGVTKERTLEGNITVAGGKASLKSEFGVLLVDHNIERPTVVLMKIAEKIDVKANMVMTLKK